MVATVLSLIHSMPIAMEVSWSFRGIPAVTAVGVVVAGLRDDISGYLCINKNWVLKHQEPIGFSVGLVSHARYSKLYGNESNSGKLQFYFSLCFSRIISLILAPFVIFDFHLFSA